jgi:hypothetical protein
MNLGTRPFRTSGKGGFSVGITLPAALAGLRAPNAATVRKTG